MNLDDLGVELVEWIQVEGTNLPPGAQSNSTLAALYRISGFLASVSSLNTGNTYNPIRFGEELNLSLPVTTTTRLYSIEAGELFWLKNYTYFPKETYTTHDIHSDFVLVYASGLVAAMKIFGLGRVKNKTLESLDSGINLYQSLEQSEMLSLALGSVVEFWESKEVAISAVQAGGDIPESQNRVGIIVEQTAEDVFVANNEGIRESIDTAQYKYILAAEWFVTGRAAVGVPTLKSDSLLDSVGEMLEHRHFNLSEEQSSVWSIETVDTLGMVMPRVELLLWPEAGEAEPYHIETDESGLWSSASAPDLPAGAPIAVTLVDGSPAVWAGRHEPTDAVFNPRPGVSVVTVSIVRNSVHWLEMHRDFRRRYMNLFSTRGNLGVPRDYVLDNVFLQVGWTDEDPPVESLHNSLSLWLEHRHPAIQSFALIIVTGDHFYLVDEKGDFWAKAERKSTVRLWTTFRGIGSTSVWWQVGAFSVGHDTIYSDIATRSYNILSSVHDAGLIDWVQNPSEVIPFVEHVKELDLPLLLYMLPPTKRQYVNYAFADAIGILEPYPDSGAVEQDIIDAIHSRNMSVVNKIAATYMNYIDDYILRVEAIDVDGRHPREVGGDLRNIGSPFTPWRLPEPIGLSWSENANLLGDLYGAAGRQSSFGAWRAVSDKLDQGVENHSRAGNVYFRFYTELKGEARLHTGVDVRPGALQLTRGVAATLGVEFKHNVAGASADNEVMIQAGYDKNGAVLLGAALPLGVEIQAGMEVHARDQIEIKPDTQSWSTKKEFKLFAGVRTKLGVIKGLDKLGFAQRIHNTLKILPNLFVHLIVTQSDDGTQEISLSIPGQPGLTGLKTITNIWEGRHEMVSCFPMTSFGVFLSEIFASVEVLADSEVCIGLGFKMNDQAAILSSIAKFEGFFERYELSDLLGPAVTWNVLPEPSQHCLLRLGWEPESWNLFKKAQLMSPVPEFPVPDSVVLPFHILRDRDHPAWFSAVRLGFRSGKDWDLWRKFRVPDYDRTKLAEGILESLSEELGEDFGEFFDEI